jgi:NAD(P)-dependent dehydrogenase (short-subunit alcohol dehydrogenase family)
MTTQKDMKKVALVTGSSTGIGFETALLLARSGYQTYATMRDTKKSERLTEIARSENLPLIIAQLDVNNDKSVKDAINKIYSEKERIDVIVNNAGYGLFSPIEELTLDQIKEQFETNFFGAIRVIHAVIPIMRKQRAGTIVNLSSLVGRVGLPLSSAYVATKFALEGLSESVRYELSQFGINVILIEPGVIKTNFIENLKTSNVSDSKSNYADLNESISKRFETMMANSLTSPKVVAETILNAVTSEDPKIRYIVGEDAQSIMKIRNDISDEDFENWIYENIIGKQSVLARE